MPLAVDVWEIFKKNKRIRHESTSCWSRPSAIFLVVKLHIRNSLVMVSRITQQNELFLFHPPNSIN